MHIVLFSKLLYYSLVMIWSVMVSGVGLMLHKD